MLKKRPTSEPLRRAAMIMELIALEPSGLTIAQIVERLALPAPTVFRIVQKLVGIGWLEGSGRHAQYRVGARMNRVAEMVVKGEDLTSLAGDVMQGVADELHLSVFLASLFEQESTFIMIKVPRTLRKSFVHPGPQYAVHASAGGKALMAYQPRSVQNEFFEAYEFRRFTSRTITSKEEMVAELDRTRARGYAVSIGESDETLWGIAYPVRDANDTVVYSIGVVGLRNDRQRNESDRTVHETVASAAERLQLLFRRSGRLPSFA